MRAASSSVSPRARCSVHRRHRRPSLVTVPGRGAGPVALIGGAGAACGTGPIRCDGAAGDRHAWSHGMPDAKAGPKRSPCRPTHKEALARGREEGRAVRRYLEAIEQHRPRRGRKRTPESITRRLAVVNEKLAGRRRRWRGCTCSRRRPTSRPSWPAPTPATTSPTLEEAFVKVARSYGRAQGHRLQRLARRRRRAPTVLERAGISRRGRPRR